MHAIPLILALLLPAPLAAAGEHANKIAIALALAEATAAGDEHSVLASAPQGVAPSAAPPTRLPGHTKKAEPAFKEVRVTKTRKVWGKISCNRNGCRYGWINQKYTVTERVPVTSRTGGYPTTNKKTYRLNEGKGPHADWKHLTEGVHAGKYDPSWLRTLSQEEINALHSDDHMGTVKKNFIVRPH